MARINLIKNLKDLISVRVPLETVPTNGKFKFDSKNNDSKSNYSNNSDDDDDDDDDDHNNNNNSSNNNNE